MEELSRPVRTGRKAISNYRPNYCPCRRKVETRRVGTECGLLGRIIRKKDTLEEVNVDGTKILKWVL
jgi:hypothetical protein